MWIYSFSFRRPGSGVEPGKLGECNTTCPKLNSLIHSYSPK